MPAVSPLFNLLMYFQRLAGVSISFLFSIVKMRSFNVVHFVKSEVVEMYDTASVVTKGMKVC
jgi:hypothetical protein